MDQTLINILTSLPGIFIASAVSYFFSQRKYTFEKLHDKKLTYLEEIYGKIISIEKDLNAYVHTTGSMVREDFLLRRKDELKPIQDKFFKLQEYFWEKEIILNKNSVEAIQSFIDVSIKILSTLTISNISLEMGSQNSSYEQWNSAYETMKNELEKAKAELKEDFRSVIES